MPRLKERRAAAVTRVSAWVYLPLWSSRVIIGSANKNMRADAGTVRNKILRSDWFIVFRMAGRFFSAACKDSVGNTASAIAWANTPIGSSMRR